LRRFLNIEIPLKILDNKPIKRITTPVQIDANKFILIISSLYVQSNVILSAKDNEIVLLTSE